MYSQHYTHSLRIHSLGSPMQLYQFTLLEITILIYGLKWKKWSQGIKNQQKLRVEWNFDCLDLYSYFNVITYGATCKAGLQHTED